MVTILEPLKKDLIEFFRYANTMPYIYSRYRRLPMLASLAERFPADEIAESIRTRLKNLESDEDLAVIYGLIVALSFKPYSESRDILNELRHQSVAWVGDLAAYAAGMARSSVEVKVGLEPATSLPVTDDLSPVTAEVRCETTPLVQLENIHA